MTTEYRRFSPEDVRSGFLARMRRSEDNIHHFDACIVVKVEDGVVYLERPMMRISSADTSCPTAAILVERYSVSLESFVERFESPWTNSSNPYFHGFSYSTIGERS